MDDKFAAGFAVLWFSCSAFCLLTISLSLIRNKEMTLFEKIYCVSSGIVCLVCAVGIFCKYFVL